VDLAQADLHPYFSFAFDGIIWQVLTDVPRAHLILEIRHANHTVSFAAVDVSGRQRLWEQFRPPDTWWSSGVLAHDGILFLQIFPEGHNPDPHGIIAVEIASQKILWQQPGMQFIQLLSENRVLARMLTAAEPTYYTLAATSGDVLTTGSHPVAENPASPIVDRLQFPVHYTSNDTYFQTIATFLQQILKISPKNAFDYAETPHCILISYYIYVDNQTENYLVAFDTHSRVPLLHEKLATQRTGIGKDTYFIFDQYLIFVKEQSLLLSYEI
jgi:hypothetical protein